MDDWDAGKESGHATEYVMEDCQQVQMLGIPVIKLRRGLRHAA